MSRIKIYENRAFARSLLFAGSLSIFGCDASMSPSEDELTIDGVSQSLSMFIGTCTFTNGLMTITSTAAQSITVGLRAVDSAIMVNGTTLSGPCASATKPTLKQVKVAGSASNEVLIVDFLGGTFAPGIGAAIGWMIDLGGGTDELRFRGGSSVPNSFYAGTNAIAFNADAFPDVSYAGIESLSLAGNIGNDVIVCTNPAAPMTTRGVSGSVTIPVVLSGGDGNDLLVGGDSTNDTINAGAGDDVIDGGKTAQFSGSFNCGSGYDVGHMIWEAQSTSSTCELRLRH